MHTETSRPAAGKSDALHGLERLHLIMGEQCNVRCTMCYQTDFSPRRNMTREIYAEKLANAYAHVQSVKLQGGEPTIMQNCRELAELLAAHPHVGISMSTNGIRLDGFWRETLLRQGGQVEVSLHSACEETHRKIVRHGEFAPVVRNIEALTSARKGQNPRVAISVVILEQNARELSRIVELAAALGVDWVKFAVDPLLSFSGLPPRAEMIAELERVEAARQRTGMKLIGLSRFRARFIATDEDTVRHDEPCLVPYRNLVVDHKGNVRACVRTWASIGNLYEASLEEIWNGDAAWAVRLAVESGDHAGCEAWCPENRNPSRFALVSKYATYAATDPTFFAKKVEKKLVQLGLKAEPARKAG